MNNIGKMTEIDVKCSTIIEILSEVIQNYLLKESDENIQVAE
nr:hypothetical protein [Clostridioides difficile]